MPWQKLRFPGCEMKTLLFDPKSGLATMLMKMEPGAVLPDHEHVLIEQTYVLEGSLVDKEGPDAGIEVGPGEFVWRPAGSRHVAWSPKGGTFIAMFQIPTSSSSRTAAWSTPAARTGIRPGVSYYRSRLNAAAWCLSARRRGVGSACHADVAEW